VTPCKMQVASTAGERSFEITLGSAARSPVSEAGKRFLPFSCRGLAEGPLGKLLKPIREGRRRVGAERGSMSSSGLDCRLAMRRGFAVRLDPEGASYLPSLSRNIPTSTARSVRSSSQSITRSTSALRLDSHRGSPIPRRSLRQDRRARPGPRRAPGTGPLRECR
jgi:hypothetical protein